MSGVEKLSKAQITVVTVLRTTCTVVLVHCNYMDFIWTLSNRYSRGFAEKNRKSSCNGCHFSANTELLAIAVLFVFIHRIHSSYSSCCRLTINYPTEDCSKGPLGLGWGNRAMQFS